MKILSTFTMAGISFGFMFSLFSAIRYYLLYPDMDRASVYVLIGIIIMAVSWIYQKQIEQERSILACEDGISDLHSAYERQME